MSKGWYTIESNHKGTCGWCRWGIGGFTRMTDGTKVLHSLPEPAGMIACDDTSDLILPPTRMPTPAPEALKAIRRHDEEHSGAGPRASGRMSCPGPDMQQVPRDGWLARLWRMLP
jgi:hypothetical protein